MPITIHEAEVIDSYGTEAERRRARRLDTEDRWDEVPDRSVEKCATALCHLDPEGWRFYLPAYMVWTLHHFKKRGVMVPDHTIYALDLSRHDRELREYHLRRFRLLDGAQSRAVVPVPPAHGRQRRLRGRTRSPAGPHPALAPVRGLRARPLRCCGGARAGYAPPMLVDDIKLRIHAALKAGNTVEKEVLRVALGEIQTAEARGTATTDESAAAVVRKLIKSNEETLAVTASEADKRTLAEENVVLASLLPKSLGVAEIAEALASLRDAPPGGGQRRAGDRDRHEAPQGDGRDRQREGRDRGREEDPGLTARRSSSGHFATFWMVPLLQSAQ